MLSAFADGEVPADVATPLAVVLAIAGGAVLAGIVGALLALPIGAPNVLTASGNCTSPDSSRFQAESVPRRV